MLLHMPKNSVSVGNEGRWWILDGFFLKFVTPQQQKIWHKRDSLKWMKQISFLKLGCHFYTSILICISLYIFSSHCCPLLLRPLCLWWMWRLCQIKGRGWGLRSKSWRMHWILWASLLLLSQVTHSLCSRKIMNRCWRNWFINNERLIEKSH